MLWCRWNELGKGASCGENWLNQVSVHLNQWSTTFSMHIVNKLLKELNEMAIQWVLWRRVWVVLLENCAFETPDFIMECLLFLPVAENVFLCAKLTAYLIRFTVRQKPFGYNSPMSNFRANFVAFVEYQVISTQAKWVSISVRILTSTPRNYCMPSGRPMMYQN